MLMVILGAIPLIMLFTIPHYIGYKRNRLAWIIRRTNWLSYKLKYPWIFVAYTFVGLTVTALLYWWLHWYGAAWGYFIGCILDLLTAVWCWQYYTAHQALFNLIDPKE